MVLSNRLGNKAPRSLVQRTLIYVLGFSAGALVIALGLSFVFVSLAEGILPGGSSSKAGSAASAGQPVRIIGAPPKKASSKGTSRKRPARGNEASDAKKGGAEGRL